MRLYRSIYFLLLIITYPSICLAANQISVEVKPENKAVKDNIEAYIGSFENEDLHTLVRLQPVVIKQTTEASQALGYYDVTVNTHVSRKKPHKLKVKVTLGTPIRIGKVSIVIKGEAAQLKQFKVPNNPLLKTGSILDQGAYENAKSQIQGQAVRYGFFFGNFTKHQLIINPELKIADINIEYQSGPRAILGKVTFTGSNNPFSDELLDRFVNFKPGTPYDSQLLATLNNNLQSSNYFQDVLLNTIPEDQQHLEIPITVQLSAVKSHSLGIGLGASTDIGPRATFSWERPWINSQGHKLGFSTELSKPRQNISGWYQIPMEDPLTDNIRFTSGLQHEDLVDTESALLTLGVERNKKLNNGWMRTISLRWQNEKYTIGDDDATRIFLMPGINLSYLRADNTVDPTKGYRLQFDLSGAKKNILSSTDFIRYSVTTKGLYTFAQKHRFLGRAQVGGIQTNEFDKIPPSLRFYAGGDQSVRGYDYQTLSPKDKKGKKVGGRYLLAGSLEYQYQFAEKWRVATFIDKGNAMDSWSEHLKTGIGTGIIWISPVGPIRVDLAHGIEDNSIRLHLLMGPEL